MSRRTSDASINLTDDKDLSTTMTPSTEGAEMPPTASAATTMKLSLSNPPKSKHVAFKETVKEKPSIPLTYEPPSVDACETVFAKRFIFAPLERWPWCDLTHFMENLKAIVFYKTYVLTWWMLKRMQTVGDAAPRKLSREDYRLMKTFMEQIYCDVDQFVVSSSVSKENDYWYFLNYGLHTIKAMVDNDTERLWSLERTVDYYKIAEIGRHNLWRVVTSLLALNNQGKMSLPFCLSEDVEHNAALHYSEVTAFFVHHNPSHPVSPYLRQHHQQQRQQQY